MCTCVLRVVLAIIAALSLGACALDPLTSPLTPVTTSGSWKIEKAEDRVTGGPIASAMVVTRKSSNTGTLFSHNASMQLACFIDRPVVTFSFDFKIGTNLNSFLGYRFDEKPGHEIGARFVQGASTVVIEDRDEVAQFVSELATSRVLYVRLRSYNGGRTAAEFPVDGAPAAIQAAFAHCPVKPAAPPARTASLPMRRGVR